MIQQRIEYQIGKYERMLINLNRSYEDAKKYNNSYNLISSKCSIDAFQIMIEDLKKILVEP